MDAASTPFASVSKRLCQGSRPSITSAATCQRGAFVAQRWALHAWRRKVRCVARLLASGNKHARAAVSKARPMRGRLTWKTPMVMKCTATGTMTAADMRHGGGRSALRRRQGGVVAMKAASTVAKNRSGV